MSSLIDDLSASNGIIPLHTKSSAEGRLAQPENWYAEPFTKRTACRTPGQCGGDCDCGCPYNTMTELERLPLIEEIAQIFPNEWLAFIISPQEDDDFEPVHGKLVAHSPEPDPVYDAVNTVLWNQHVYVFFNGDFAALQASYGDTWAEPLTPVEARTFSGPKQAAEAAALLLPDDLLELVYSVVDQLYGQPNLNEAIRRLRLARVRAAAAQHTALLPVLDGALDQLETALPRVNEVKWFLEEALLDLETVTA
ncbi:MAG: hypothetical protein KDI79_31135 [Anaerolineae bacterium]|nr:hypothetical protein [Anaerolineae bacterium]